MARARDRGSDGERFTASNISDADFAWVWSTPNAPSKMPGELQDVVTVNTATLKEHPEFAKALTGVWFETLALVQKADKKSTDAKTMMATASGTDLPGFEDQLRTTHLYYSPAEAVAFFRGAELPKITDQVMTYSFDHGLQDAKSKDVIGIELPGRVLGDKGNVKLRFDPSYMEMAAEGKL